MDLAEIRMRCVEAACQAYAGKDLGYVRRNLVELAMSFEEFVLKAEQDALDRLK